MTTQRKHTKRGMALPEFLITLAILSILATVVVVGYINFIDRARIAADDSIIEQLNLLITAHKIETGELPTGDEISQILQESGVTFDQITPSSSNRHLYYDNVKGCFVWIDDDEIIDDSEKKNYTEITDSMFTPTEPKDDEGQQGETEKENPEQSKPGKTDPDKDESEKKEPENNTQNPTDTKPENTVTFTVNTDYSYSGKKNTYINVEDSKISIGFHYDVDSPESKTCPEIDFGEIISARDNNGDPIQVSFDIQDVNIFTYPGEEDKASYTSSGDKITFNKAGIYKLTCTAEDYVYEIEVQVINLYYNQASVSFGNPKTQIAISFNSTNYTIKNVNWSYIIVSDYDFGSSSPNNTAMSEYVLTPQVILVIMLNDTEIEIAIDGNKKEYDFKFSGEATECTVKLKYLGANGEIVYSDSITVYIK